MFFRFQFFSAPPAFLKMWFFRNTKLSPAFSVELQLTLPQRKQQKKIRSFAFDMGCGIVQLSGESSCMHFTQFQSAQKTETLPFICYRPFLFSSKMQKLFFIQNQKNLQRKKVSLCR